MLVKNSFGCSIIPNPKLVNPDFLGQYRYVFTSIPYRKSIDEELQHPDFPYKVGDRIGQIYLEEIIPIEFQEVEELEQTQRGSGGFGSTGLK